MASAAHRSSLTFNLVKLALWLMLVVFTLPWWGGQVFEVDGWWRGASLPKVTPFAPVWASENLRADSSTSPPVSLDDAVTDGVMVWRHADLSQAAAQVRSSRVTEMRRLLALDQVVPSHPAQDYELEEILRLAKLDAGLKMNAWRHTVFQAPVGLPGQTPLMQAQASLEQAVQETGLAGLWVSPSIARDAGLMEGLADNLRQANRELQHITGWSGGVLGLGGRVVMWPLLPQQSGLGGRAWADEAGFIHVVGSWTSMAHEWFHALDNAVAQDSYRYPVNALNASEQMTMRGRARRTSDADAFADLVAALQQVSLSEQQVDALRQEIRERSAQRTQEQASERGLVLGTRWSNTILALSAAEEATLKTNRWPRQSPWLHWRNAAASELLLGSPDYGQSVSRLDPAFLGFLRLKQADAAYLLAANETLAYAFEGQTMWGKTPLLSSGQEDWASAVLHPTTIEAKLQTPIFAAFFVQLSPWWTSLKEKQENIPKSASSQG